MCYICDTSSSPSSSSPTSSSTRLYPLSSLVPTVDRRHCAGAGGGESHPRCLLVFEQELTGSNTFFHLDVDSERWIGLVPGLQSFEVGQRVPVYLEPEALFYFDLNGELAHIPALQAEEA